MPLELGKAYEALVGTPSGRIRACVAAGGRGGRWIQTTRDRLAVRSAGEPWLRVEKVLGEQKPREFAPGRAIEKSGCESKVNTGDSRCIASPDSLKIELG